MFKKKPMKNFNVKISIPREILESIFDECDKYEEEETGGRIIGYYEYQKGALNLAACGSIGPGPKARRSPTSFYQDGEYQESIFRRIEAEHPKIEHLGNWHTHHVNGLETLSAGDLNTYTRIVNHEKHNTDFFYALLVVARMDSRDQGDRYRVKHFLFRRGESSVHEIPHSRVKVLEKPAVFADVGEIPNVISSTLSDRSPREPILNEIRSRDKVIMQEMYPNLSPFFSKTTNSVYWKGNLSLIDGSSSEILLLESTEETKPLYYVNVKGPDADRFQCHQVYKERCFDSAWKAACSLERDINREIFHNLRNSRSSNSEGET